MAGSQSNTLQELHPTTLGVTEVSADWLEANRTHFRNSTPPPLADIECEWLIYKLKDTFLKFAHQHGVYFNAACWLLEQDLADDMYALPFDSLIDHRFFFLVEHHSDSM